MADRKARLLTADQIQDLRPFKPGERRDNPDGTYSTELTATVQLPNGKWINIPTLWMGPDGPVELEEEAAIDQALRFEKESGKPFERFDILRHAVRAAEVRSRAGGASEIEPAN